MKSPRRTQPHFHQWLILIGLLIVSNSARTASEERQHFLVLKLGDATATQEAATEYLQSIAGYLGSKAKLLGERPLHGWIANEIDSALAILKRRNPMLVFAPAGFYLQHLKPLGSLATPIVQTPRFGKSYDKYYIVAAKDRSAQLSALHDETIRCVFAVDLPYLQRVVFPVDFQPNVHFRLVPSQNLADDMFLLLESGGQTSSSIETPAAILLDEELKQFFEVDDLVWPELQVVWESEPLPREIFVTIGEQWTDRDKRELLDALMGLQDDPIGQQLLDLMQSSGFTQVDTELLEKALQRYAGIE